MPESYLKNVDLLAIQSFDHKENPTSEILVSLTISKSCFEIDFESGGKLKFLLLIFFCNVIFLLNDYFLKLVHLNIHRNCQNNLKYQQK